MRPPVPPSNRRSSNQPEPMSVKEVMRVRVGLGVVAFALSAILAIGPAAGAAPGHSTLRLHVKTVHLAINGCRASTTVLTAAMTRLSYSQHQAVTVNVSLTNNGNAACGVSNPPVPGGQPLTIGPCGDLSLVIRNGTGKNVYPGQVVFHCAPIFGVEIPAHTSVSTTGTWNQASAYNSKKLASRGKYKVSIAGKLTFTITLTGSSKGPLPA
jgi:hypothetical protein